jgi:hypothetical protein
MTQRLASSICACVCLVGFSGPVLAKPARPLGPPSQAADNADPSKGSKDIDQTVAYPMAKVLDAAKQAVLVYGCDVKKEKPDSFECTRDRHIGAFVGSGGEKVTVQLSQQGSETRVRIKTGKGFAGRLGKKNWSTPIFNEMVKTLKGS